MTTRNLWREMNTAPALTPDLWSTLPRKLIVNITRRVLIDLPFSKLYSFGNGCKLWRDFLIRNTHYLLYLNMGKLKALNSRTGMWEEISLEFCIRHVPDLELRSLRLVSSAGGLLCLSNTADGEYIVCNPLTQCCKRLGKLCFKRSGPPRGPRINPRLTRKLGTRVIAYITWVAAQAPLYSSDVLMICQWDISGSLELQLTSSNSLITNQRKTVLHEDRRTSPPIWKHVVGVPDTFRFYVDGPVMVTQEQLALGFCAATHTVGFPAGFKVLVYDFNLSRYKWFMSPKIPRRRRKQVVATIRGANQVQFEEVQDTGHTDVIFPPPLRIAFEDLMTRISEGLRAAIAGNFFEIMSIEQDDVVYLVAMVARELHGPYNLIAVWRHCRVDNSDLISERKADWSGPWPLRSNFHIFKPSFACTHSEVD